MKAIPYPATGPDSIDLTPVDAEKVISGAPRGGHYILHSSESGEFSSGVYVCTPGKWTVSYDEDEFCTLVEGAVIISSENGEAQAFKAPCSFMIPSGFRGAWEALTPVRKFFVIYEKKR
jgi:uncharacterized cupin superfamily protein